MIHRGRLTLLNPQQPLGLNGEQARRDVRLVLHTSHPIPGLRIDELRVTAMHMDVNAQRRADAERRVLAAVERLQRSGDPLTGSAVARAAHANRRTVSKALGTPVHTPREELLYRGVLNLPQLDEGEGPSTSSSSPGASVSPVFAIRHEAGECLGSRGKPLPSGQECPECAAPSAESLVEEGLG